MFALFKIFILFFLNVIYCGTNIDKLKKTLERIREQANLLSTTDRQLPFIEKLLSYLPDLQTSINELQTIESDLIFSTKTKDILTKDKADLKTINTDLFNRLIDSKSNHQTAEKAIVEKDKKIKNFKSARSKLQKVAYITTIIAGVIVTYCVGRFYYDLYIN